MPAEQRTSPVVRRWTLAGLACGVVLAVGIVSVELNYVARRPDGSLGPGGSTFFSTVQVKGPDGKWVQGPPVPPAPLTWAEKASYGVLSGLPYAFFGTLFGYGAGRLHFRLRAPRRPLTTQQTDYDDSMRENPPPTST